MTKVNPGQFKIIKQIWDEIGILDNNIYDIVKITKMDEEIFFIHNLLINKIRHEKAEMAK